MYNEPRVEKRCMAITLRDTYTSSTAKLKRPVEKSKRPSIVVKIRPIPPVGDGRRHKGHGVIFVPNQIFPAGQAYILRSSGWMPTPEHGWERITISDPVPPVSPLGVQHLSNVAMVEDLLGAVTTGQKPMCSEIDGRWTVEMVAAVYQSQLSRRRVRLPLRERASGLE